MLYDESAAGRSYNIPYVLRQQELHQHGPDDWTEENALQSAAQDVKDQIALLNTPFPAKAVKASKCLMGPKIATESVESVGAMAYESGVGLADSL
ncbi:hypothetical protein LTR91_023886 [Friedmanniomyces endolithicus]|uniref:Uncharacterized protein n=1 Tax=Friedmanniomyces endolithicus TaxID=329885 RepID=A0AAN6H369_9PEZI|nr:hypothetical protein LTR01_008914 [Friedmanniomyces endolithicus]KAK0822920.1 hypothetical protein LTR73_008922 [Friedmanniomyces endolithicus]KAK0926925.1 hypothetical protein LTR29_017767 [Friedmanniomyces endolithicus]KAK0953359.1 hypothetical protein LTR91_023886 [Friedmanniomyces endolithicus]KAK1022048.1 hypothetical protein LTS16_026036 [Friedmanniomyces endolithicus]